MQPNLPRCLFCLTVALFAACEPSDRSQLIPPSGKPTAASAPLRTFVSDTTPTRLLLRADSTFTLEAAAVGQAAPMSGKMVITQDHYRLFFPNTTAHFNELITSVHPDGSVVAYPDYSVALDKELRQVYVHHVLLTADSTARE